MNNYDELIKKLELEINKELYDEKIIDYDLFEIVQSKLSK